MIRRGRPLADPTVIYGLGERFDGNLRKKDLQTDTPYNTYLRRGLPPTPIALPGANSIKAAVQPAQTKALYFVARGDGSSVFSDNLADRFGTKGSPISLSTLDSPPSILASMLNPAAG